MAVRVTPERLDDESALAYAMRAKQGSTEMIGAWLVVNGYDASIEHVTDDQAVLFVKGGKLDPWVQDVVSYWLRHLRAPMWLVGCAVRTLEGEVFSMEKGRHYQVYQQIKAARPEWRQRRGDEDGFVTSTGRFLTRRQAEAKAYRSGQLKGELIGPILTSEDLW